MFAGVTLPESANGDALVGELMISLYNGLFIREVKSGMTGSRGFIFAALLFVLKRLGWHVKER